MLQATNDFLLHFLGFFFFLILLILEMKRIEITRNSYIVSPLWGHLTSRNSSMARLSNIFYKLQVNRSNKRNENSLLQKFIPIWKPQFVSYLSATTQLKRLNFEYSCAVYPSFPLPFPLVFRWAVSLNMSIVSFFLSFFAQTENFPFEIYWVQKHFFSSVVCFLFRNLYLSNAHSFTHSPQLTYHSNPKRIGRLCHSA